VEALAKRTCGNAGTGCSRDPYAGVLDNHRIALKRSFGSAPMRLVLLQDRTLLLMADTPHQIDLFKTKTKTGEAQ